MILASLFPVSVAFAIFFGTLRQRGPTQAEREDASARLFDGPRAAKTVAVVVVVGLSLLVVGAVRVFAVDAPLRPLVLS
jgi:hypothetical protein